MGRVTHIVCLRCRLPTLHRLRFPPDSPPSLPPPRVSLTWNASSDAVGVTGYRVYRNGTQIAALASNSYIDGNLVPGTYSYTVAAVDAAGNVSAQSGIVSATIASPFSNGQLPEDLSDPLRSGGVGSPCLSALCRGQDVLSDRAGCAHSRHLERPSSPGSWLIGLQTGPSTACQ